MFDYLVQSMRCLRSGGRRVGRIDGKVEIMIYVRRSHLEVFDCVGFIFTNFYIVFAKMFRVGSDLSLSVVTV